MKVCIILISLSLLAISSASLFNESTWTHFKTHHKKAYKTSTEEKHKLAIFKENLKSIEEHNKRYDKGEESYFLKITQFADLTKDEFINTLNSRPPPTRSHNKTRIVTRQAPVLPAKFDWRTYNIFNPVKNQLTCGSCYCFTAVGLLESYHALKHHVLFNLSEQNILDCTNNLGNQGCVGGFDYIGLDFVIRNGINTELDYPYEDKVGACRYNPSKKVAISVSGYQYLPTGEAGLLNTVGIVGPASSMVNADLLQHYGGGIFNKPTCNTTINHYLIVVGYDSQNGVDYWINRNTWGSDWGENGYVRFIRNGQNQCGFGIWNLVPILN